MVDLGFFVVGTKAQKYTQKQMTLCQLIRANNNFTPKIIWKL
jgi:hypothetical protein